jgi:hypothetical protein
MHNPQYTPHREDDDGQIVAIHFHQHSRTWYMNGVAADKVHALYRALKTFNDYCLQPRNMLEMRMNAGKLSRNCSPE